MKSSKMKEREKCKLWLGQQVIYGQDTGNVLGFIGVCVCVYEGGGGGGKGPKKGSGFSSIMPNIECQIYRQKKL